MGKIGWREDRHHLQPDCVSLRSLCECVFCVRAYEDMHRDGDIGFESFSEPISDIFGFVKL